MEMCLVHGVCGRVQRRMHTSLRVVLFLIEVLSWVEVRTVRLRGPHVRKARRNFAHPLEGRDVFMYHDASTALLPDLRRRFKAVGDVLLALIRDGGLFGLGQFIPLLCEVDSGRRFRVVEELHLRLSDFIHMVDRGSTSSSLQVA